MAHELDEFSQRGAIDSPPPTRLFKFRRFPSLRGLTGGRLEEATWQRGQVFQILRGQLRLSRPDSFNDPFEFRPAVTVVEGTFKERQRSARKYIWGAVRDTLPFKRRIKLLQNQKQIARVVDHLPKLTALSLQNMRNEIEIYCLSANESRPLLWSHYADGHRGVALHMDATKPPFHLAWKVEYSRFYPTVVAGGERSDKENWRRLRQSLLVKDQDWAYEEEYRFLAPQSRASIELLRNFGVKHEDHMLHVSPATVIGITLGAKMPQDAEEDLLSFLASECKDVSVRRARLAKDRFEVEISA